MSDQFIDDDFEQFLAGMKPGRVLPQILRYRMGSDSRDWGQAGTTAYIPKNAFIQAGCIQWTGAGATSGSKVFAFKNPFADVPLVLVSVANTTPLFKTVTFQASSDGPGMSIYWWSAENLTAIWFHWMAIGPGAA